jgi:hypothetical protein
MITMLHSLFSCIFGKKKPQSTPLLDPSDLAYPKYTYGNKLVDIPPDFIFEKNSDIAIWLKEGTSYFKDLCDQIPLKSPLSIFWKKKQHIHSGTVQEYILHWADNHPLKNSPVGGALAHPVTLDKRKSIAVFIHGHGMASYHSRLSLFEPGSPADSLLEHGYIVWAPDNVYHDELLDLFISHDFPLMWAKVAANSRIFIEQSLQDQNRFVLIGIAAGGHTALGMQLYGGDYDALVTSGSFFPLELLRRDYRIQGHPNCFDFRNYVSYLPLFSLCNVKPMQIQMGSQDALWIGDAIPQQKNFFSGTKRGVFTEESGGGILILKHLAKQINEHDEHFSFVLHNGGHTDIDIQQALSFFDKHNL